MLSQPRGIKRKVTYANLPYSLRSRLDTIAAVNDVRRSFVITTVIAKSLGLSGEGLDYEDYIKRTNRRRRNTKIRRIK